MSKRSSPVTPVESVGARRTYCSAEHLVALATGARSGAELPLNQKDIRLSANAELPELAASWLDPPPDSCNAECRQRDEDNRSVDDPEQHCVLEDTRVKIHSHHAGD